MGDMLNAISGAIGLNTVPDSYTMIINLGASLNPIKALVGAIGYMIGLWMILFGIFKLKAVGEEQRPGSNDTVAAIVTMMVGVMLVYMVPTIDAFTTTAFGSGNHNPFGYTSDSSVSDKLNQSLAVIYKFIGIVGIVAIVRGCLILKGATEGDNQSSVAKGMWHLIGGVAAIHLDKLITVFKSSAGFAS